ncbi:MAG: helix-turn-helix transcriptional regulator [Candidatus Latescibacteria bacterium]|jgi:hypothetical protein|nr:helix-turn-helix transcriptional regulator [Candidatus Latescibacterota bacterium]
MTDETSDQLTNEPESGDLFVLLDAARQKSGLSLARIAESTHITLPVLQALAQGDLTVVERPFARAFLRTYALELGLDPDSLTKLLDELLPAVSPAVTATSPLTEPSQPVHRRPGFPMKLAATIGGVVLALSMALNTPDSDEQTVPEPAQEPALTGSMLPATPVPPPPGLEPDPSDSIYITMVTTDSVWVLARRDSLRPDKAAVYSPDARRTWKVAQSLRLVLGRHQGVRLFRGNETLAVPHPPNRTRIVVEVTSDSARWVR